VAELHARPSSQGVPSAGTSAENQVWQAPEPAQLTVLGQVPPAQQRGLGEQRSGNPQGPASRARAQLSSW
jgi:hypothetical protein